MKKLITLISTLLLISFLGAIDLEWMGELRSRGAATYDDVSENLDNYFDSRFRLEFDANITNNLDLRAAFEVGDFTWGCPAATFYVETNEAYINYRMDAIGGNVKIGKQYWADHRGLVFDDYFTGAMINLDEMAGFKTDLGFIKFPLNNAHSTWWMANVQAEAPIPMGITGLIGYQDDVKLETVSALPYATLMAGPITIDINPFLDYQYRLEKFGFGAAVKANAELGPLEVGGDLLFAAENGLTTLSSWYQNGLYLYGIGTHHDGLNLYWNNPYEHNADAFMSLVGNVKFALTEQAKVFGAAGLLTDLGIEVNAGVEYQLIPDFLSAAGYLAVGVNDSDRMDAAFGATILAKY